MGLYGNPEFKVSSNDKDLGLPNTKNSSPYAQNDGYIGRYTGYLED